MVRWLCLVFQPAGGDEAVNVGDERPGHRVHRGRGGVVVAAAAAEDPKLLPARGLLLVGAVDVEVVVLAPPSARRPGRVVNVVADIGDAARSCRPCTSTTRTADGPIGFHTS
jgi:hypothetical protein